MCKSWLLYIRLNELWKTTTTLRVCKKLVCKANTWTSTAKSSWTRPCILSSWPQGKNKKGSYIKPGAITHWKSIPQVITSFPGNPCSPLLVSRALFARVLSLGNVSSDVEDQLVIRTISMVSGLGTCTKTTPVTVEERKTRTGPRRPDGFVEFLLLFSFRSYLPSMLECYIFDFLGKQLHTKCVQKS